ncbi:Innexin-10 [Trichinella nelsoni]|uniref:Innexin n=1 Tax=Trichinella nelsoni TaxID=6336 RepID=A0A0V0RY92_9BILA|nr:Innexin-10 [Trichinella nelsoni]
MSYLYSALSSFFLLPNYDDNDDATDQLHYRFTSCLLIVLAMIVSFKQFGGRPIECMVPEMFSSAWEQYAESFCWAQDNYFIPFSDDIPDDIESRQKSRISYYQWVPFFLLTSALSFQIPYYLWRIMSHRSGIRLQSIIEHVRDPKNVMPDVRRCTLRMLTVHIENALKFQRRVCKKNLKPHKILLFLNLPYTSNYISVLYLIIKCLYLANVIGQFLVMNFFLETQTKDSLYGWHVLRNLLNGTQWHTSGFFPRVTLCDFEVRVMGNLQRYSVQCVLVINLFNEKIFIFLWFWYHLLTLVTLSSFIYWFSMISLPCFSKWFITRHLELADMPFDAKESRDDVRRFVGEYLRADGVFVLRFLNMSTGVIFTSDLIASLWRSFYGAEDRRAELSAQRWPSIAELNWLKEKRSLDKRQSSSSSSSSTSTSSNATSNKSKSIGSVDSKALSTKLRSVKLKPKKKNSYLKVEQNDDSNTLLNVPSKEETSVRNSSKKDFKTEQPPV